MPEFIMFIYRQSKILKFLFSIMIILELYMNLIVIRLISFSISN
jgi:hypothetical protein